ncbi:MAG: hypothetical protein EXS13_10300 [Planctomycetes bacterium]|nr:hypothetical protein [Planctomycetota bacterium]
MRHGIQILFAALVIAIVWRVAAVAAQGRAQHEREVRARSLAERILEAQFERAGKEPKSGTPRSFAFLGRLVDEGRLLGLERVVASERDLWRAGDYLFHVRLLNQLDRPIVREPADPSSEPGLGLEFELWAWPADQHSTSLALFFGSDAGNLLQGDNGTHAGLRARPEDGSPSPQNLLLEEVPDGANSTWIVVRQWRRD